MPRIARHAPGVLVDHVLNRSVGRMTLFEDAGDYFVFLRVFHDVLEQTPIRVCGYCIMPQPLTPGPLAQAGRRPGPLHAAADDHPPPPLGGRTGLAWVNKPQTAAE